MRTYSIEQVSDGWIVVASDGAFMGKFGWRDQARDAIPGFQAYDYRIEIANWNHFLAHSVEPVSPPILLSSK